jgi:hypothetical protein
MAKLVKASVMSEIDVKSSTLRLTLNGMCLRADTVREQTLTGSSPVLTTLNPTQ